MTVKLSYDEAKQTLEIKRAESRRVLEARHKAEIQDLEATYRAKLQLLDEIWSDSGDKDRTPFPKENQGAAPTSREITLQSNGSDHRPLLSGSFSRHTSVNRRSVNDEVQIILDELRDEIADDDIITQRTVRERYEEKYPGSDNTNLRSQISHTLKQLSEEDGPLELVERGTGSEPSKYRMREKQGEAGLLDP